MAEKPGNHLPEYEAEENEGDLWFYDDRWLFNGAVFFLLFPFTIFVSFVGGSLIPLGFGVALVDWRVAATPEIVNRISSNMNSRLRGFLRNLVISLGPGLILLDLGDYVTRPHFLGFSPSIGFPLAYSQIITSRCSPGGCLYTFDPLNIVLDYFLWALLSLVIITSIRWALTLLRNARQLPGKV